MRCEAMREAWLSARYAGEVAGGDVRAHIAGCAGCSAWQARQSALDTLLAREPALGAGPGFDERFFARLEAERGRVSWLRRHRRQVRWIAPVALAAAVALAVLVRPERATEQTEPPDIALLQELELVEELPVVSRLEEIEAYEALAQLEPAELDAVLKETQP